MRLQLNNHYWTATVHVLSSLGTGEPNGKSDAVLIARVRRGDKSALAHLWIRHSGAGLRAARAYSGECDAEDIVAEAFARIHTALRGRTGPNEAFRPYLYATIKNLVNTQLRLSGRVTPGVNLDDMPASEPDGIERALDASLVADAFRSLPERWQSVLWYMEVERLTPAATGALMGLKPNAVSALGVRAREGLRTAWVQVHLDSSRFPIECRETATELGGYSRGVLAGRPAVAVGKHLEHCKRCVILVSELDEVAGKLAVIMLPLLLGTGAAAQFIGSPEPSAIQSSPPGAGWAVGAGVTLSGLSATAVLTAGLMSLSDPPSLGAPEVLTFPPAVVALPVPQTPVEVPTLPTGEPESQAPGASAAQPVAGEIPAGEPPRLVSPVGLSFITNQVVPTLSGTGTPGATVVIASGAWGAEVEVSDDSTWSAAAPVLIEGTNWFTVSQRMTGFLNSFPVIFAVTLDAAAPAAPGASILQMGVGRPYMRGEGEPGCEVVITSSEGVELARTTATETGDWAVPALTLLEPTSVSVTVTQADLASNVSAKTVVVLPAPVPAFMNIADGDVKRAKGFEVAVAGWSNAVVDTGFGQIVLDANGVGSFMAVEPVTGVWPQGYRALFAHYVDSFGVASPVEAEVFFIASRTRV